MDNVNIPCATREEGEEEDEERTEVIVRASYRKIYLSRYNIL